MFVIFWRTSAPRIGGTAAEFSRWGYTFPLFPKSGFGFSYPAVPYLGFLCSLIFCDGECYNQAYSDTLMAVLQ